MRSKGILAYPMFHFHRLTHLVDLCLVQRICPSAHYLFSVGCILTRAAAAIVFPVMSPQHPPKWWWWLFWDCTPNTGLPFANSRHLSTVTFFPSKTGRALSLLSWKQPRKEDGGSPGSAGGGATPTDGGGAGACTDGDPLPLYPCYMCHVLRFSPRHYL